MKQAIALVSAFALPVSTYAEDATSKSAFENLIVATAPVIMLFFLMWLAMRLASRKTNAVNERIVESNERIAKSLEELVSILRKKIAGVIRLTIGLSRSLRSLGRPQATLAAAP